MTDYSRSNGVLSPSFEEAALFLEALVGKDAPCTFQTFDDMKVWNEDKKKLKVIILLKKVENNY